MNLKMNFDRKKKKWNLKNNTQSSLDVEDEKTKIMSTSFLLVVIYSKTVTDNIDFQNTKELS